MKISFAFYFKRITIAKHNQDVSLPDAASIIFFIDVCSSKMLLKYYFLESLVRSTYIMWKQ